MSLIAWLRKTTTDDNVDGWQIALTDHAQQGLKLFSSADETHKMRHAIYRGIITDINAQGIFIKADTQSFFMRHRQQPYHIGQKLLLQLEKIHPTAEHKHPRVSPHIRLENYYWRYDDTQTAISLGQTADNNASLMAWASQNDGQNDGQNDDRYPHDLKVGLHLKKIGQGVSFAKLLPEAEKLLQQYQLLRQQQSNMLGRLSAEQPLTQQALKFPIAAWHVPNKHLALIINNQLAEAGLQMPVHIRDDCDEIVATLADEQTSHHHGDDLLIFNHLPSGWLIDVNSHKHIHNVSSHQNHQQFALHVNLLAVQELCRLIYLKEIYGIIIVDFIGMRSKNNRQKLHHHLQQTALKLADLLDSKAFMVHGFTRAGLFEIERPTDS